MTEAELIGVILVVICAALASGVTGFFMGVGFAIAEEQEAASEPPTHHINCRCSLKN